MIANDPVKFCHIAPTHYLRDFTSTNGAHLLLAHLVESDPAYRDYYANLQDGKYKILDNSAFEMFKLGREMYDSDKLIEMGRACKADCIVMSDYPKEVASKTINKAREMASKIKDAGFDTFFVPQSRLGDLNDLVGAFGWALNNHEIDLIGVSILACPIGFGVNETVFEGGKRGEAYRLQRFLSRWALFSELEQQGLLNDLAIKRFHCLGMTDGPNEIQLLKPYHKYIFSWDSSAAVWAGINGIRFDNSPTGLMNGKYEHEVDFSFKEPLKDQQAVWYNISVINALTHEK